MSEDEDVLILFDSVVQVVESPVSTVSGDVVVTYLREEQDYKIYVRVTGKSLDKCCSVKQYKYELQSPLTVERVDSCAVYKLRLDSGNVASLTFDAEKDGIAFAGYVLAALWATSDRLAPLTLTLRQGAAEAPIAAGHEVKISWILWDVASDAFHEHAFVIESIGDSDRGSLTKRLITVGSGEIPLLDSVLVGMTRKTKFIVAADGVVMYVDVSGQLSAATPPPNLSFQMSTGDGTVSEAAPVTPTQHMIPPPHPRTRRDSRKRVSTESAQAERTETDEGGDAEDRPLLDREHSSEGVVHVQHGRASFPIDVFENDVGNEVLTALRRMPLHLVSSLLASKGFIVLRLLAHLTGLVLTWVARNTTGDRHPYGRVAVTVLCSLGVVAEALHLYKSSRLNILFETCAAHRNDMPHGAKSVSGDLRSVRSLLPSLFHIASVLGAPASSALISKADSKMAAAKYVVAVVLPLLVVTLASLLLRFTLLAAVLRGTLHDTVPPLNATVGGRRKFALDKKKGLSSLVATWGVARQVVQCAAEEWSEILLAIALLLSVALGWATWSFAHDSSDYRNALVLCFCSFSTMVFFFTHHGGQHAAQHGLARYLQHYEWQHSDEAAQCLRGSSIDTPLWATGLAYFSSCCHTPAQWKFGLLHFSDQACMIAAFLAGVNGVGTFIWALALLTSSTPLHL